MRISNRKFAAIGVQLAAKEEEMVGDADPRDKTAALQKTPAPQNHPRRAKGARFRKRPLQRHLRLGWLLVRDAD
jgi:hypothetical protein